MFVINIWAMLKLYFHLKLLVLVWKISGAADAIVQIFTKFSESAESLMNLVFSCVLCRCCIIYALFFIFIVIFFFPIVNSSCCL